MLSVGCAFFNVNLAQKKNDVIENGHMLIRRYGYLGTSSLLPLIGTKGPYAPANLVGAPAGEIYLMHEHRSLDVLVLLRRTRAFHKSSHEHQPKFQTASERHQTTNEPCLFSVLPIFRCPYLSRLGVELVKGGQHEHSGLAHPRLGLANDIHAQNGLATRNSKTEATRKENVSAQVSLFENGSASAIHLLRPRVDPCERGRSSPTLPVPGHGVEA